MKRILPFAAFIIAVAGCSKKDEPEVKPAHTIAFYMQSSAQDYSIQYNDAVNGFTNLKPSELSFSYTYQSDTLPAPNSMYISCRITHPTRYTKASAIVIIDEKVIGSNVDTAQATVHF